MEIIALYGKEIADYELLEYFQSLNLNELK